MYQGFLECFKFEFNFLKLAYSYFVSSMQYVSIYRSHFPPEYHTSMHNADQWFVFLWSPLPHHWGLIFTHRRMRSSAMIHALASPLPR